MKNLTSPFLIKFKGIVFLLVGIASGALLILELPTIRVAVLLAITIWGFCRSIIARFTSSNITSIQATASPAFGPLPVIFGNDGARKKFEHKV
ncbi:MAG TPA: hypothetical protein VG754_13780 [Verrucomicrobiae bacterium]|jgi:hypothetical protein|nr:hypothetical protein [Verrucomicrobiae bacterium]